MKIEKIEKYLEEVSEGTDFSFTVEEEENKELTLYMQGDNPEGEDWCETLTIQNPKTKRELLENLCEEIMAKIFPNLKETDIKVKESQRAPNKLNPKGPYQDIITKMAKVSMKRGF